MAENNKLTNEIDTHFDMVENLTKDIATKYCQTYYDRTSSGTHLSFENLTIFTPCGNYWSEHTH